MPGSLSLVLHAHLPFVRHPEHERFLEETWLFEAITESYLPLLQVIQGWARDEVQARLTLTLTPTLCSMLKDGLLQERYRRYLAGLLELAQHEVHRTLWEKPVHELALFYLERFNRLRAFYESCNGDLVGAFRTLQDQGQIEIITSAATHALLPLLADHPPSLRGQLLVARDHYRGCFGRDPVGIWLPECAYVESMEPILREAGLRWFITDTHGILHARPRPRYGVFAPVITPDGLAAFGRDVASAKQVWSRHEGYPGDPRYRDFYRDAGFDLDLEYLRPYLATAGQRHFTGLKYFRITGGNSSKAVYERGPALQIANDHAAHFLGARLEQMARLEDIMGPGTPPLVLAPYDAELFGHWWYEGPEFLDLFVRKAWQERQKLKLMTPSDYLRLHPDNQVVQPAASSWGEEGYWRVWLNESNAWILPHLEMARRRMTELARDYSQDAVQPVEPSTASGATPLEVRALNQAARELLLAQSSDWPFILRTGTSPDYARKRVKDHLLRFNALYEQLRGRSVDETALSGLEQTDNLFPEINFRYWA